MPFSHSSFALRYVKFLNHHLNIASFISKCQKPTLGLLIYIKILEYASSSSYTPARKQSWVVFLTQQQITTE